MRIGTNPLKKTPQLEPYKRHRILMPVHIGEGHDYFRDSDITLGYCLRTLYATIDRDYCNVTLINNASKPGVRKVIEPYLENGLIDKFVDNNVNRGKPDAIAAEILATYEPFVTLTDCDVLFRHGWLQAIEKTFMNFPGCGSVSPFPAPNHQYYFTSTTWLDGLLKCQVDSGSFVDIASIDEFLRSIGKPPDFFPREVKERQFALSRNGERALIGSGHFVVTFRRSMFHQMVYQPKLAGASNGEAEIDERSDKAGWLRLSTEKFHVYHLGNTHEGWMENAVQEIESRRMEPLNSDASMLSTVRSRRPWVGSIPYWVRRNLLQLLRAARRFSGRGKAKKQMSIVPISSMQRS